jgi:hypothetical protein
MREEVVAINDELYPWEKRYLRKEKRLKPRRKLVSKQRQRQTQKKS